MNGWIQAGEPDRFRDVRLLKDKGPPFQATKRRAADWVNSICL
ncbi:hypothetical protein [Paenibacillus nasutitermitis]|nr:hypothetical protein [Paenibacillus nasutitermitis]